MRLLILLLAVFPSLVFSQNTAYLQKANSLDFGAFQRDAEAGRDSAHRQKMREYQQREAEYREPLMRDQYLERRRIAKQEERLEKQRMQQAEAATLTVQEKYDACGVIASQAAAAILWLRIDGMPKPGTKITQPEERF